MLRCNMDALTSSTSLELGLDDLLGDLRYARKRDDLGRIALLVYCEVRRWARQAGEQRLAARSSALITQSPHPDRARFLAEVDELIAELERAHARFSSGIQLDGM
jgi:hypothetical protein